jgi:sodium/bile acid cotransporter 7
MGALRRNWFTLGLLVSLALGWFFSSVGSTLNPGGWTNRVVVLILFLITGLTLPTERIVRDLANARLHITIQLFIFLVVPLLFRLTAQPLLGNVLDGQFVIGIYALAVLPTTISTCIVLTQNGGGNAVAAVFNAALSNMLGVFLSPLLLSLLLSTAGRSLAPSELVRTLRDLGINMLAPIVAGNLLRLTLSRWVARNRARLSVVSSTLVLLMLFLAFSRTAANPDFTGYLSSFWGPICYLAVAHLVLVGGTIGLGALLRFDNPDRVTLLFVAPQKTLALGVPLLGIYFAGQEVLGIVLLPLVFYHPFQIFVAGLARSLPFVRAAMARAHGGPQ